MAIGRYKSIGINVTDLEQGYSFWSEVLGWKPVREAEWHGWLGYLDDPESDNFLILIKTPSAPVETNAPTQAEPNRVHLDIYPSESVDKAIVDILALGGTLKKPPSLYPRPGSQGSEAPAIDWAVMQDPFGNEFCIVEHLTSDQARTAMESSASTDHDFRIAAGVTTLSRPEWA